MRIWQPGLAAVVVSWLVALPCGAQSLVLDGGVRPVGTVGYGDTGRISDRSSTRGALFPERADGLGISSQREFDEDGSRSGRKGLIASTPIAENVNVGVGIFSVTRYSPKERELSRTSPMKDVGQRTGSLAAVGMSIRF